MSTFEDRLGVALRDLSDDVAPVPLLARLQPDQPDQPEPRPARRLTVVAAAAMAAVVIGVAALVWARLDGPPVVDPAQHPPKVFHVSGLTSEAPGRAAMAVTFSGLPQATSSGRPIEDGFAYLLPVTGDRVVALPGTSETDLTGTQLLAAGGRVVVRQNLASVGPTTRIVDLVTGRTRSVAEEGTVNAALSPDGASLAVYTDRDVRVVDVATGGRDVVRRLSFPPRTDLRGDSVGTQGEMGWSPDGALLAVHDGPELLLVNRVGTVARRLSSARLVNGSQSWSPDGSQLLVYDGSGARFSVRRVDGRAPTVLTAPPAASRPMGWAGSQVVWLTGQPGAQHLLACDLAARDCRTWMRFDVGAAAVEGVTWSPAYAGTAGD